MTDPHGSSDIGPEEQVRRLLAQARHEEPIPDDVAARLDRVLADLRAEPAESGAPVVDLAVRRRRRRLTQGLVAAAAVVVLGVGVSRIDLAGSGGDAGTAADSASEAIEGSSEPPSDAAGSALASPPAPLALSAEGFERDVRRLLHAGGPQLDEGAGEDTDSTCPVPAGRGARVAVSYDGRPAVLVVRSVAGGGRVVDLYVCGDTEPERSVRLPAG